MRFRNHGIWLILLLFALSTFGAASTLAQAEVNADDILVAKSFDQKYMDPAYIAYSGIEAIARQGLAVHHAREFDQVLIEGNIVYVPAAELLVQQPTSEIDVEMEKCYDRKFWMEGHVTCRDQALIPVELYRNRVS